MTTKISVKGEGGQALVRGEGDMSLQLACEILNHPEIELVGLVPEELGAYIGLGGGGVDPLDPGRRGQGVYHLPSAA